MSRITLTAALVLAGLAAPTPAQVEPRKPCGRMSAEVVRMKLKLEGYTNVTNLRLLENKYSASATVNRKKVRLEVNALTGDIKAVR